MDPSTLISGFLIMAARICDVSLGTMRTLSIVQGRTSTAFFLGFLEVGTWLIVISHVLDQIKAAPVLGLFYALGFSLGNVLGIKMERKLAFGYMVLRIISREHGREMAGLIRQAGFPLTTFLGEGQCGPVVELYLVCRRRDIPLILTLARGIEPQVFFMTEPAGSVSKIYRPFMTQPTGWRAVLKKK